MYLCRYKQVTLHVYSHSSWYPFHLTCVCVHIGDVQTIHLSGVYIGFTLVTVMFTHTTDPSSPLNLMINNKMSTSLTVEWSPPLTPNGVILSYQVSYVGLESVNPVPDSFERNSTLNTNGTTQTVEVTGLSPYSQYSLSVKAFTSAGGGEETTVSFRTEEDCESAQDYGFR